METSSYDMDSLTLEHIKSMTPGEFLNSLIFRMVYYPEITFTVLILIFLFVFFIRRKSFGKH